MAMQMSFAHEMKKFGNGKIVGDLFYRCTESATRIQRISIFRSVRM